MGGKGKKLAVAKKLSQKCVKTSKTTRDKREERETKLRLRKEQARNYECKEEKEFAAELLDKGLVISIVEGDGERNHSLIDLVVSEYFCVCINTCRKLHVSLHIRPVAWHS